ncbi:MAG: hypothetical protein F6K62_12240 [Sphaerospermopsis sp. SIO1G2]|nr:hypothetical protein [Sphaerospermopsis sp. SIO1G2]
MILFSAHTDLTDREITVCKVMLLSLLEEYDFLVQTLDVKNILSKEKSKLNIEHRVDVNLNLPSGELNERIRDLSHGVLL